MIRPAYATVVLTLHREITLEIVGRTDDDSAEFTEEDLNDRVTKLAEEQYGTFDNDDEIDILEVDYLDNRDD